MNADQKDIQSVVGANKTRTRLAFVDLFLSACIRVNPRLVCFSDPLTAIGN